MRRLPVSTRQTFKPGQLIFARIASSQVADKQFVRSARKRFLDECVHSKPDCGLVQFTDGTLLGEDILELVGLVFDTESRPFPVDGSDSGSIFWISLRVDDDPD